MPVKNAMPFLPECLNSIINQTEANWQLIAVNDHSTDESWNCLDAYQKKEQRIKIFNNNGAGIIDALHLAYENCNGQFITRMDADDIMAGNKIELLKKELIKAGEGNVAAGLVKYFSHQKLGIGYQKYAGWLNQLTKTNSNFNEIYKECVIPSPCWMLHRKDLEKCNAFNPNRYPEDYDLCFRFYANQLQVIGFYANQLQVIGVDKILHYWRDYSTRTSRTDANYSDNRFLQLKLDYFLKLDYSANKQLIIWGAGDKGKWLARKLIQQSISFSWHCNNPKKIGHVIYGKTLKSTVDITHKNIQIIVAVAQRNAGKSITGFMQKHHLKPVEDYFLFS